MKNTYSGKEWLGSPVFIIEGEDENRMGRIDMIPAILVDRKQFNQIEADFEREQVHLRTMLAGFHYNARQGTLEPLNAAAEDEAKAES